ncbi:peptide ABC transporter substrate-binding protein [soil metagenome]
MACSSRYIVILASLLLAGCGGRADNRPVQVDVIGTREQLAKPLDNGSNAGGQTMLAATAQGLVAFDAEGALMGALAERWIVEDDGSSYLFRLKRARWANGEPIKAAEIARLLSARFRAYPGIVAGLDPKVRGMTDEVLEIRLPGPNASFLQLLAHPAMGIADTSGGSGPFRATMRGAMARLVPVAVDAPVTDGEAEVPVAARHLPVYLRAVRPALGFAHFAARQSDLLLGGRFQHLPYVAVASLPGNAVRPDPVNGLLGLMIEGKSDFLANPDIREMLSMAVDRDRIAKQLNLAGWRTMTTLLPEQLELDRAPTQLPWTDRAFALRRSYARSLVNNWTQRYAAPPVLHIALPAGPGARIMFRSLKEDYAAIGLTIIAVDVDAPADLRLIDEVAPFDSAVWYLARVGCGRNTLCSKDAEARLDIARHAATDAERAAALREAETLSIAEANYVPLGIPVRFALVRSRLTGYQPSPRARHPLNALFRDTR